ncbi:hypothetical protein [Legionella erythra]|uniref:Uncharacterized protein n=1 Tax=Legionella erythra TaxID=448 RepID=A0A0W0TRP1_LEGER|nr:hypothetical protein [Legionella erythra]KTC98255.1 hypothetical protein Lery_1309 [Legionella erythra]
MEKEELTKMRLKLDGQSQAAALTREEAINQSILIRKAIVNIEKQKAEHPEKKKEHENKLKQLDELLKQLLTVIDEINAHTSQYQQSSKRLEETERLVEAPAVR